MAGFLYYTTRWVNRSANGAVFEEFRTGLACYIYLVGEFKRVSQFDPFFALLFRRFLFNRRGYARPL